MQLENVCSIYNVTSNEVLLPKCMLALTMYEQSLGFQYWPELLIDDSILFPFPNFIVQAMHMRNVVFPLMMVWMDQQRQVIGITQAYPSDDLLFSSVKPVQYCLECHPDLVHKIKIGDILEFLKV